MKSYTQLRQNTLADIRAVWCPFSWCSTDQRELTKLQQKRDTLASHYEHMKPKFGENGKSEEIEKSAPMGIWVLVA